MKITDDLFTSSFDGWVIKASCPVFLHQLGLLGQAETMAMRRRMKQPFNSGSTGNLTRDPAVGSLEPYLKNNLMKITDDLITSSFVIWLFIIEISVTEKSTSQLYSVCNK